MIGKSKVPATLITKAEHKFEFVLSAVSQNFDPDFLYRFSSSGMRCSGTITRIDEVFLLNGSYSVHWSSHCSRCLEKFERDSAELFEVYLEPSQDRAISHSVEIRLGDPDIEYFEDGIINLGDCFEKQFFLDCFENPVCSPDCRGLCSVCGKNQNQQTCSCIESSGNYPFRLTLN